MKLLLVFLFLFTSLQAADLNDLTWEVNDGKVTITESNQSV